jgi:hypothetical protein
VLFKSKKKMSFFDKLDTKNFEETLYDHTDNSTNSGIKSDVSM